jgi:hypothetical protein
MSLTTDRYALQRARSIARDSARRKKELQSCRTNKIRIGDDREYERAIAALITSQQTARKGMNAPSRGNIGTVQA